VTPALQLRDYQTAGITDLLTRWDSGVSPAAIWLIQAGRNWKYVR